MHGHNIILKVERDPDGALAVHSMFYTIQGEGPLAGFPAVFLRLYGCSLSCAWCDTEFEDNNIRWPADKLSTALWSMLEARRIYTSLVNDTSPLLVITGGEPMRQHLAPFIEAAIDKGFRVQIETAGIHWQPELEVFDAYPDDLMYVVSPKTGRIRPELEQRAACLKYIVSACDSNSTADGLPLYSVPMGGRGIAARAPMYRPTWATAQPDRIFVQAEAPIDAGIQTERGWQQWRDARDRNLAYAADIAMRFGYRLSFQIHKTIGLP
jgi:7-carboxy-7-deazaguanine synthase